MRNFFSLKVFSKKMSLKNNLTLLTTVFFCAFSFSANALTYTDYDLSSAISDNNLYTDVTIFNSRTLSSSSTQLYFSNNITNSFTLTNTNTIASTGSNSDTIYLPSVSGSPSASSITINNNGGTISSSGNFGTAIYTPSSGNYNFTLSNSGTISSTTPFYSTIYSFNGSSNSYDITNSGTISNSGNDVLYLSGGSTVITNSGTIQAASSANTAIYADGSSVTLNILSGSNIVGKINGAGSNNILNIKTDISASAFNTLVGQLVGTWTKNMASGSTLTIANGETVASANLGGTGAISNSGTLSALSVTGSGNTLTLASGSTTGDISNSGALSVATGSSNISYGNVISGTGSITKTGSGRLELTGTNTYSGATTVSAGELKVNGSAASSAVTVASGATISGTGTVGDLTIQSGGILSAGNSPGTLNVSGNLTLNSGSTTNFEFTSSQIDKIVATGNISIAGTANFQLYGTDGYFTVSQNILETTGGTVSGTFDSNSTDNGFSTSLTYSSSAVHATISKTLNSNTLDGALSSQNSVGRLISKSLVDQLRNSRYCDTKKTTAWISGGGFGAYMAANGSSSAYSSSGTVNSAGLINNYGDFQLVGGVFNSQANIKRFTYLGKDTIDTNGAAIGLGKNFTTALGNLYAFTQFGVGFYSFNTNRNVNVNGASQVGKGSGNGGFQYLNLGVAQTVATSLEGELGIFASATFQKTQHNGWHESGLSAGNLDVSRSSADTLNFEVGTSYKDDLPKLLHLPKDSFYKLELTGYKSELYSKKNATVTESTTSYSLSPTYNQKFTLGTSAYFAVPLSQSSTVTTRFDKRQNGTFRESVATLGYLYGF